MRLIGSEYAPDVYDVFHDEASNKHVIVMEAADDHSELSIVSRKRRGGLEVQRDRTPFTL